MRSQSRRFFIMPVSLAATVAMLSVAAPARPRAAQPHARSGTQPSFAGEAIDGQSLVHQQPGQAQAHPGFTGGTDDGQSIRRRQPRHGGNHPHGR
jgi:hypothetical protein